MAWGAGVGVGHPADRFAGAHGAAQGGVDAVEAGEYDVHAVGAFDYDEPAVAAERGGESDTAGAGAGDEGARRGAVGDAGRRAVFGGAPPGAQDRPGDRALQGAGGPVQGRSGKGGFTRQGGIGFWRLVAGAGELCRGPGGVHGGDGAVQGFRLGGLRGGLLLGGADFITGLVDGLPVAGDLAVQRGGGGVLPAALPGEVGLLRRGGTTQALGQRLLCLEASGFLLELGGEPSGDEQAFERLLWRQGNGKDGFGRVAA